MWIVLMIFGGIVGGAIAEGAGAVLGGACGIFLGLYLKGRDENAGLGELRSRVEFLEGQVKLLIHRLEARGFELKSVTPTPAAAEPSPTKTSSADEIVESAATGAQISASVAGSAAGSVAFPEKSPAPATEPARSDAGISSAPPPLPERGAIWELLFGGNILAKVGVALLFFGVASGLKLAVQYGMLPVPVRLAMAAAAAIAMIWFGADRVRKNIHLMFGYALQGGGFALLYLVVYFMLARYQMVGPAAAFGAFALIGAVCVYFAARQDAQSLAGLGLSGAFLAPVLASTGAGNYVVLFSYYLLVNAAVIAVNWFKGWRYLNAAAFAFTFLVGIAWGMRSYRPENFATVELFLIAFFLMFSALPMLMIVFNAPGRRSYADGLLLFGTPIAATALQQALVSSRNGLALSAFLAGVYYLALGWTVYSRREPQNEIVERAHFGIGAVFLTLAVPLAFGVTITTVLWALEGAVLAWYGARLNRRLAVWAGFALQALTGLYLLLHYPQLALARPIMNDFFVSALLISAAGYVSGYVVEKKQKRAQAFEGIGALFASWGLLWLLGAIAADLHEFVARPHHAAIMLAAGAAILGASDLIGRRLEWGILRIHSAAILAAMVFGLVWHYERNGDLLSGYMLWVFGATSAIAWHNLYRHDCDELAFYQSGRHVVLTWIVFLAFAFDFAERDWLQPLIAGDDAADRLTWALLVCVFSGAIAWLQRAGRWPLALHTEAYRDRVAGPLLGIGLIVVLAMTADSARWALPYIPVLNPLEAAALIAIYFAWQWARGVVAGDFRNTLDAVLSGVSFILFNTVVARCVHHYAGVAYSSQRMLDSALFHGILSVAWTVLAIALMIHSSRSGHRTRWYAGFWLLAAVGVKLLLFDASNSGTVIWTATLIGVALLVIAASYFAPRPPAVEEEVSA